MLNPNDYVGRYFQNWEIGRSQTAERDGIDNTPPAVAVMNAHRLALQLLDPIRERFGRLDVSSWYRSKELNSAVGGSSKSYHLKGLAADVVPRRASPEDVMRWLMESDLPFDQAIYEESSSVWLHLQVTRSLRTQPRRMALMKMRGRGYSPYNRKMII